MQFSEVDSICKHGNFRRGAATWSHNKWVALLACWLIFSMGCYLCKDPMRMVGRICGGLGIGGGCPHLCPPFGPIFCGRLGALVTFPFTFSTPL